MDPIVVKPIRRPKEIHDANVRASLTSKEENILDRSWFLVGGLVTAFLLLQFLVPLRTAITIGADEHWELSKATLSMNGHQFYTEVWNDQPLLHTAIITQILKHVSPSVLGPRLVTSAFSMLLLTSLFFIALRVNGLLVATLATAFLIVSPGFLELGSSCMVEIPALAPAVAGLACLLGIRARNFSLSASVDPLPLRSGERARGAVSCEGDGVSWCRSWLGLIAAGVFFGISLQIKFINIILLPLIVLIVWLRERSAALKPSQSSVVAGRDRLRNLTKSLVIFFASLAGTFILLSFALGAESYWIQLKQSWSAHFASTRSYEYGSPGDHPFEWSVYLKNWDTSIPALLGIIVCLQSLFVVPASAGFSSSLGTPDSFQNSRQNPLLILPFAWFAIELIVFGIHKPWWSYYYIHNAVPLCWCAAIGIAAIIGWLKLRKKRALIAVAGICALLISGWMVGRVYLQISSIRSSPKIYSSLAIKEVERYKPFTKFIYTDEPAYSFHTGIPMVPSLAVVTLKRLWTGDMTNARIVEELRMAKPGVILLKNSTEERPFTEWLATEYRLVYHDGKHNLYAHKSIANKVE